MAAGLAKIALMASWGAATPTPPMERDMGPTPMRLDPLVARASGTSTRIAVKMVDEIKHVFFH